MMIHNTRVYVRGRRLLKFIGENAKRTVVLMRRMRPKRIMSDPLILRVIKLPMF